MIRLSYQLLEIINIVILLSKLITNQSQLIIAIYAIDDVCDCDTMLF